MLLTVSDDFSPLQLRDLGARAGHEQRRAAREGAIVPTMTGWEAAPARRSAR